MDKDKIFKIVKTFSNYDEELRERYLHRIAIAINFIETKLRENVEKNNEIILTLCAALVNLWITMENCSCDNTTSFSANGYKIKKNLKRQCLIANKLFDHWRAVAAKYLIDEGFSFFAIKENAKWTLKKKLKKT